MTTINYYDLYQGDYSYRHALLFNKARFIALLEG
jgi:hypothetical protein